MISIQEHLRQLLQTVSPSKMLPITLSLDAPLGLFKLSANKPSPRCQSKKLHCTAQNQLLKRWMFCSNKMEIAPNSLVCLASGSSQNRSLHRTCIREKMHVI